MSRSATFIFDIAFIVIISILFFTAFAGSYHLIIPDEGRYAEVAREMLVNGNWITPHLDGVVFLDKPMLMYWLEGLAMKLWGVNELAVRIFPACFGVLGVILTYLAGRQLFNRRTAIIASLVLMTSLLYFLSTHYVDMDLAVAVLVSGALWFFIMAMEVESQLQRKSYLWVAYIFAALAFLTKGLIGIVFPIMIIGVWILAMNEWKQLKRMCILSGFGIFLLLTLPWYIMVQMQNPGFFHYFFIFQQFERFTGTGFNMHNPLYFYPLVIIVGMFPWVIFLFQSLLFVGKNIISQWRGARIQAFLVLWPLLILVFFSLPKSKIVGYILPVFPPLAMIIAVYLNFYWDKLAVKKSLRWALAVLCVIAVIMLIAVIAVSFMPSLTTTASRPYLFTLAFLIIVSAVICYWMRRQRMPFSKIFYMLLMCSALLSITGTAAVHTFELKNAKSLALLVKRNMQPSDQVAYFYSYSQDVPFYLNRQVYVVLPSWKDEKLRQGDNWRSEFALGIDESASQKYMIDYQQMKQLWNSSTRMLVIVKDWKLKLFVQNISPQYFLIGHSGEFAVISNKGTEQQLVTTAAPASAAAHPSQPASTPVAHPATSASPQSQPQGSPKSSK